MKRRQNRVTKPIRKLFVCFVLFFWSRWTLSECKCETSSTVWAVVNMATRRQNAFELTFYTVYFIFQALTFPGILLFDFSKYAVQCKAMPCHAMQRNDCANASEQMVFGSLYKQMFGTLLFVHERNKNENKKKTRSKNAQIDEQNDGVGCWCLYVCVCLCARLFHFLSYFFFIFGQEI